MSKNTSKGINKYIQVRQIDDKISENSQNDSTKFIV